MVEKLVWRILLIDDDQDDYLLTREMLALAQGKEIILEWASSFEIGRQAMYSDQFDAVLIDYDLGEHTGLELIREAAGRNYTAPLILITGRGGYEVDLEAMQAGATLYLTKSEVNPLLLDRSIRYAIERKQAEKALKEAHQNLENRVEDRTRELAQANIDLKLTKLSLEERVVERTEALLKANEKLAFQLTEGDRILNELKAEKQTSERERDLLRAKEEQISRISRLYAILSRVNEAIVRVHQPEALLAEVCRIVAEGDFPLVWFGEVRGHEVVPVASAGSKIAYLNEIKVEIQGELGKGPTGTCIRENHPVINDDFYSNPVTRPWRNPALKYGIRASAALPIRRNFKVIGALTLYSQKEKTFDSEMVALLESLAADISYALDAMDQEMLGLQVERDLKKSESAYRSLFEGMTEGFGLHEIVCDEQGKPYDYRFLEINPAFEHLTGLKREDVIGKLHNEVMPGDDPYWLEAFGQVALTGNSVHFENYSPALGQHYEGFAYRPAPRQFAVLFKNITEKKQLDDNLRESEKRYRTLFESVQEGFYLGKVFFDDQGKGCDFEYLDVNPAFEKIMNLRREQIIGHRAKELVANIKPGWAETFGKVQQTGEPTQYSSYSEFFGKYFEAIVFRPAEGQFAVLVTDISQRKQAEEKLEQQHQLIELSYEPIFSWDLEKGIQDWNKGCEQLYGFSREEALGKVSHELLKTHHPEPLEDVIAKLKNTCSWSGELRHTTKDGCEVVVESRQQLIYTNGLQLVLESNRNITERKEAEQALRESQERIEWLARFPEENPNPVVRTGLDGRILYHNPPAANLPGWNCVVGQKICPTLFNLLPKAYSQGSELDVDLKLADRYYAISVIPLLNEGYANIYARDITKRRIVEDTLRQREAWFRTTLDSIGDAVITTDENGAITFLNPIAEKLSGWTNSDAVGKPMEHIFRLVNEQTGDPALNPVGRVLESGTIVGLANHTALINREGQPVPIEDSAAPIKGLDDETVGVVMVFHDVSEKRKKETALLEAQELLSDYTQKLERSNRELQDFAAMASHDLQEPLRKIKAFGDLIEIHLPDKLDEQDKNYIQRMHNAAVRMQNLIQSLLAYSRVTTKAQPFSPVDLHEVTTEVILSYETQIERLGAHIQVNGLPEIYADGLQMRQLFQNLVSNALKFHNLDKPLQIQINGTLVADREGQEPDWVRIEIIDNGVGFDMKHADRIFKPFERLHGRSEFEGTGMGLAICKRIVERHNGSIMASSEIGQGATFTIVLPIKQSLKEPQAISLGK